MSTPATTPPPVPQARLWLRYPALTALLVQGLVLLVLPPLWRWAAALGLALPLPLYLAAHGLLAGAVSRAAGLGRWWLIIQAAGPFLFAGAWALALPGWLYSVLFLALLTVFWNAGDERVPLYLSNRKTTEALAGLLAEKDGCRVADIGSGLGGPLLRLARRRPDCHFEGFETAPLPYLLSRLRQRFAGLANVTIKRRDLWRQDLGRFDLVYCFLSPAPMAALYQKAQREMRPGSLLVSNSFPVPGIPAERVVTVDDRRQTRLYLYPLGQG